MRAYSVGASILLAAHFAGSLAGQPDTRLSGRWEGKVEIPGRPLILVIDLAPGSSGQWIGSATVPGFGVKGAPLIHLEGKGSEVSFALDGVLSGPTVKARIAGDVLKGEFSVGGNSKDFTLRKTGPAQVDAPLASTPVQPELVGEWRGSMVYMGNQLQVKLGIKNGTDAASATLVFVREKDMPVPVVLVRQEDSMFLLETAGHRIRLEAALDSAAGELRGALELGGAEVPLVLRKENAQ